MRWHLFANVAFEDWDWRNSVLYGIGGSETSQCEMARGLAGLGHEVYSYAPIPKDCPREWEGTHWKHNSEVDFNEPGIWMLYRCPEILDHFDASRTDQVLWLCFQDYWYPTLTADRLAKLGRAVVLCRAHERFLLDKCPEVAGKTWITRNAIKNDLIAEVEAAGVPDRNPYRMMYASSPDRGLKSSLQVFQRVKEHIPEAELWATYGYDNLDKLIAKGHTQAAREKDECLRLVEQTGAQFVGRIPQRRLYEEWLKTNVCLYITTFFETGWITGLEAQALGAIPVFSPVHVQIENTRFGVPVAGDPNDPLTIAKAAAETVNLMRNPELQEQIRGPMMKYVRENFGWEQFVHLKPGENWVEAAEQDLAKKAARTSASFAPVLADNPDEAESRRQWLHVGPGDVVIDVGACDGSWALPAAEAGATVYAIDPEARTTRLVPEAERRNLADRIHVLVSKVGDATTDDTFTLDSLVLEAGLAAVRLVKIDVEGDEMAVLRGAQAMIRRFKPGLMVEVHTDTVPGKRVYPGDVTRLLESLKVGYAYDLRRLEYQGGTYWHLHASVGTAAVTPAPALPRNAAWSADGLPLCDNGDEIAARDRWLHLSPGDVMLDIGAADGRWAVEAVRQGATARAFDPNRQTWLAGVAAETPGVVADFCWVGDAVGERGGIPATTVDALALPRVDFVKIDVEGEELAVLRGMRETLARHRPRLMVEVHTETVPGVRVEEADVTGFLDALGLGYRYEPVRVGPPGSSYTHLFCWSPFRAAPKVTVVTATIRPEGLPMVAACLDRQTFRDFEWVVSAPEHLHAKIDAAALGCTLLADPPKRPGDFYRLNGAWNACIARARGELVLFVCDWTWFPDDAVGRVWRHYLANPNVGVTSVGGQYRTVGPDGVPADKWEDDPRPGMFAKCRKNTNKAEPMWRPCEGLMPIFWEQAFAAIGRRRLIEVGGFDEDYDRVCANSEKELAFRLYADGYRFLMDESLQVKNYTHERMNTPDAIAAAWAPAVALLERHQYEILGDRPVRLRLTWPYAGKEPADERKTGDGYKTAGYDEAAVPDRAA